MSSFARLSWARWLPFIFILVFFMPALLRRLSAPPGSRRFDVLPRQVRKNTNNSSTSSTSSFSTSVQDSTSTGQYQPSPVILAPPTPSLSNSSSLSLPGFSGSLSSSTATSDSSTFTTNSTSTSTSTSLPSSPISHNTTNSTATTNSTSYVFNRHFFPLFSTTFSQHHFIEQRESLSYVFSDVCFFPRHQCILC